MIIGIELLKNHSSVLVLDYLEGKKEQKLSFFMNALEAHYLKSYGKREGISSLEKIDQFLIKETLFIHLDQYSLRFGSSAYTNLIELERKTDIFSGKLLQLISQTDADEFQVMVQEMLKRSAEGILHYQDLENLNLEVLLSYTPDFLKKVFSLFQESFRHQRSSELFELVHCLYGLHQKRLVEKFNSLDLFFAFISLLSPQLRIKRETFKESLSQEFVKRGGDLKKSQIRQWSIHQLKPWAIELTSFDGVIHPEELIYLDLNFNQFPLKMKSNFQTFLAVECNLEEFDFNINELGSHLFHQKHNRGSEIPLRVYYPQTKRLMVYFKNEPGLKVEFIQEKVKKEVQDMIAPWTGNNHIDLLRPQIVENDFLIDQERHRSFLKKGVKMMDSTSPSQSSRLKSVRYVGPGKNSRLGRLSRFSPFFSGNLAQTSLEYLLLIVVVISIMVPLLGIVQRRIFPGQEECVDNPAIGCRITRTLGSFGSRDPNFRTFKVFD